ncbi:MAG: AAA family ATPase, partial [Candidatus Riflebacteria bacterium]|nr:AAA family ATPase [Candidatus Riflebacteria bacterium]
YFPLKRVGRELKYSREVTGILHALARELARSRLGSGETAILDGTFLRGPGRLEAARVAAERGDDVLFVKVTAPREVILARLACRRSGVDHASEAGPEVHDMMERRLATGEDGYSDLEIDLGQGRCPGSLLVVDTGARTVRIATANRLSSGVALGFVGLGYSLDPGGRRSQTPAGS